MRRSAIRAGLNRKSHAERYKTKSWVDRLSGIPAFILGNGYSLKNVDLSLLSDYFTIGINRAFKNFDPTILLWQDISFWKDEYQHLEGLKSIKLAADGSDPSKKHLSFHLKSGPYEFHKRTYVFYGRGSTGPIACELAYALGCHPIILLGMDCKRGPQGQSDFWGENKHWTINTLPACTKGLIEIKEKCPVEVISCSQNDVFEKQSLTDVLKKIDPNGKYKYGRQFYADKLLVSH